MGLQSLDFCFAFLDLAEDVECFVLKLGNWHHLHRMMPSHGGLGCWFVVLSSTPWWAWQAAGGQTPTPSKLQPESESQT